MLAAGYPVYVLAWDRNAEFPALENVRGVAVRSLSPVKLTKLSRVGLALGAITFQTYLLLESVKLIRTKKKQLIIRMAISSDLR